jgi:tetratricopeptide (TPR) repeat protein
MTPSELDAHWDFRDAAATEQVFRGLLNDDMPLDQRMQLTSQIARTQGLQRHFDDAHSTLDTLEAQLEDCADPLTEVRYLLERGRTLNSSGDPAKARPLFERAHALASAAGEDERLHYYALDALHMVAIVAPKEAGLAIHLQAIDQANASPDKRAQGWLGPLLNNTGWSLHALGDFARALDLFQQAVVFREARGSDTSIRIAHWCVARTLRSLKRYDEALQMQRDLEEAHARAETGGDGYVQEEIGELLLLRDDPAAATHFAQAFARLGEDAWLLANEGERVARWKRLSEVTAP